MPSLEELQLATARCVLGHASGYTLPLTGSSKSAARLGIYRNNTRSSLTTVLLTVFPVTAGLVDERFFRYAASDFISRFPPAEARLARYGAGFPRFLKSLETLAELPFVAEVARLEWAIAEALDAKSEPPLALEALAGASLSLSPCLRLQPSLRLIALRTPVLAIWQAHQAGQEPAPGWRREVERIALWRCGDAVRLATIGHSDFAFRHALAAGCGLEPAVKRALARDPMFDLLGALVRLIQDGLVVELKP
ncbi:hypothetical protein HDIA_4207 [Hartmannibacter diazotrophicus]|uniref:Putative DNA-binding domain-containing protein n=1 Tax=Hartmannibacter diazotrophicus TaxID=1482074 RepID=A0A2C9DC89_9HYPH|nr:DNA-binding domain-containing protein [Hartmannibacter diazotrophicus]SON57748.1 hypothetical protein HDIA_4207 [Hartmannibacter diazotrophicus]